MNPLGKGSAQPLLKDRLMLRYEKKWNIIIPI